MDRLWALKRDFDPFGRLFFGFSAVGFLLRITRCSVYRCPYCRWIFKITWGPSNALLGRGERPCWHCKKVFWDGSNEWPEMSSEDRRLFLVPITIAGLIGAFVLIPALILWMSLFLKQPIHFQYGLFSTILGLPLGLWFGFRALRINESVRRYNARGKAGVK